MGIKTMRIAFSCTCQPNMKAVRPHRVIARMNASLRTILKRRGRKGNELKSHSKISSSLTDSMKAATV